MKFTSLLFFLSVALPIGASQALADISVILNPKNPVKLTQDEIKNIFMGKVRSFPDGASSKPVDQSEGQAIRNAFYEKVANKSESEMKVYWSNLIFTGYGVPPKTFANDDEVKKFVKETSNGIGYIDSKSVDGSIKEILIMK